MQENYSEFQEDNWVVYLPERNYCTIKSLSPNIILKGALQNYPCRIEQIGKIEITEDKLQVCGFEIKHPIFVRNFSTEIYVALMLSSPKIYTLYKNDERFCEVQYIHQVQNAYYQITGELLSGNLYGVREG